MLGEAPPTTTFFFKNLESACMACRRRAARIEYSCSWRAGCLGGGSIGACVEGQGGPKCTVCLRAGDYYDDADGFKHVAYGRAAPVLAAALAALAAKHDGLERRVARLEALLVGK